MYRFPHETLDAYRVAVEISRAVRRIRWPRGDAALGDQARRASSSIALNLAEGHSKQGASRRNHYRIARGSAAEVCAVLDVVDVAGGAEVQRQVRRVGLLIERLEKL